MFTAFASKRREQSRGNTFIQEIDESSGGNRGQAILGFYSVVSVVYRSIGT
jgi:hypothetical protein